MKIAKNNLDSEDELVDPVERAVLTGGRVGPVVKLLTGHAVTTKKPQDIAHELRKRLTEAAVLLLIVHSYHYWNCTCASD